MAVGGRVLLAALALVMATVPAGSGPTGPGASPVRAAAAPVNTPQVDRFHSIRTFDMVVEPVRLRIPALQVDTALEGLARQPDGTIAVPDNPNVAGWYDEGPRPGQPGPAVIVGHVDSVNGPAVFFRLDQLSPGAAVYVDRADGSRSRDVRPARFRHRGGRVAGGCQRVGVMAQRSGPIRPGGAGCGPHRGGG